MGLHALILYMNADVGIVLIVLFINSDIVWLYGFY